MSYIIPIGNGSFVSAKNKWFCMSSAVTRESLGYYSWIMIGYRVLGYLTSGIPILATYSHAHAKSVCNYITKTGRT